MAQSSGLHDADIEMGLAKLQSVGEPLAELRRESGTSKFPSSMSRIAVTASEP